MEIRRVHTLRADIGCPTDTVRKTLLGYKEILSLYRWTLPVSVLGIYMT